MLMFLIQFQSHYTIGLIAINGSRFLRLPCMYIYTAVTVCLLLISELSVLHTLTSLTINRIAHTNYNKKNQSQINVKSTSILSRIVVQINIHFMLHFFANQTIKDINTTHQLITQHLIYIEKQYILSRHEHKQLLDLSSWRA